MNNQLGIRHKLKNLGQTWLLIISMALVLAMSGRLLFGQEYWLWILLAVVVFVLGLPSLSPYWLLRLYRAERLHPQQVPQLYAMLDSLTERATLPVRPQLFWVPSQTLNAFTVGTTHQSAIAISDGLLRELPAREMMAVLAHEISHIRNNDLRLMTLADSISRLTNVLSTTALLTLLLLFPLVLLGKLSVSIAGLLLIVFAPTVNALLQLGLSRVREFDADLDAARLTQDPPGLASALMRIDQRHNSWMHILLPGYRAQQPSILRSHPPTDERVQRLMHLQDEHGARPQSKRNVGWNRFHPPYAQIPVRKPRYRFFSGIWY